MFLDYSKFRKAAKKTSALSTALLVATSIVTSSQTAQASSSSIRDDIQVLEFDKPSLKNAALAAADQLTVHSEALLKARDDADPALDPNLKALTKLAFVTLSAQPLEPLFNQLDFANEQRERLRGLFADMSLLSTLMAQNLDFRANAHAMTPWFTDAYQGGLNVFLSPDIQVMNAARKLVSMTQEQSEALTEATKKLIEKQAAETVHPLNLKDVIDAANKKCAQIAPQLNTLEDTLFKYIMLQHILDNRIG